MAAFCLLKKFLCCFELKAGIQTSIVITFVIYFLGIVSGVVILEKRREDLKVENKVGSLEIIEHLHNYNDISEQ